MDPVIKALQLSEPRQIRGGFADGSLLFRLQIRKRRKAPKRSNNSRNCSFAVSIHKKTWHFDSQQRRGNRQTNCVSGRLGM